jgi:hypothetical protein
MRAAAMEAEAEELNLRCNPSTRCPTTYDLAKLNLMSRLQTQIAVAFIRFIRYAYDIRCKYRSSFRSDISAASRPLSLTASIPPWSQQTERERSQRSAAARRLIFAAITCSESLKRLAKAAMAAADFDGLVEAAGLAMQAALSIQPSRDASPSSTAPPSRLAHVAWAVFRGREFLVTSALACFRRMTLEAVASSSGQSRLSRSARACAEAVDRLVDELQSSAESRAGGAPRLTPEALHRIEALEREVREAQRALSETFGAACAAAEDLDRSQAAASDSVRQLVAAVPNRALRGEEEEEAQVLARAGRGESSEGRGRR